MQKAEVLICGAGPTGLAATLFLSELGIPVRIIDKLPKHSGFSKALGVNARTLSLLKPTGVTETLLQSGIKMYGMNTWRGDKRILHLDLSKVDSPYKFMLINPQFKTEDILADALAKKGINIERQTELTDLKIITNSKVKVSILGPDGNIHLEDYSCLFAADGAHSTVRSKLNINFPGTTYPEPWHFYDLELTCPFPQDQGQMLTTKSGAIVMLPMGNNIWRLGGSVPNLLEHLPAGCKISNTLWDTTFKVSHRVIEKFACGPVFFGGDAAHLHSPVGGRGMNLGIEDAFVFSTLYANGRLVKYARFRQSVVQKVVAEVERMSQMPRAKGAMYAMVDKAPTIVKAIFPIFAPSFGKWVLGLDHPVIPDKR